MPGDDPHAGAQRVVIAESPCSDRSKVSVGARTLRGTIPRMAGSGPTIQIPRWIQLVVLPVLLVLAFLLAAKLGHVLFLFLTASVIAFTLNPWFATSRA